MAELAWYVREGDASVGPMTMAALLRSYFSGRYSSETMVHESKAPNWRRLGDAFNLAEFTPPPLPAAAPATDELDWATVQPAWSRDTVYAWRRYFARQLDLLIYMVFSYFLLGAMLAAFDGAYVALISQSNAIVQNIVGVFFAAFPSAIVLGVSGRSLGKLIFGLRVLDEAGRPPGLLRALRRELQLTFQGLGVGVPLVALFTMWNSFARLGDKETTAWDDSTGLITWYRRPNFVHWLLMLIGVALWISMLAGLYALGSAHAH